MNKREFSKLLNKINSKKSSGIKYIDVKKIFGLSDTEKSDMVYFIIRHRLPVVKELIPQDFDMSWLHSMGYLYETQGKLYTFVHTSEQKIK